MIATFTSLAIFGSFVWFAIIASIVLIMLFVSEHEENGFIATLVVTVFCIMNYFWGNVPVFDYLTWRNVGIYLFVGFLFSLVRTFFKGSGMTIKERENFLAYKLKGHVFRWWFLFPVSAIYWMMSDVIKEVWNFIYRKLSVFYGAIFKLSKPKGE